MKHFLAIAVTAGFAAPVCAQMLDFASVDADRSGTVSLQELQAVIPGFTDEQFAAVDMDGSADLDEEEFAALFGG